MEPEILKFEDILRGCLKRWKTIVIFAIFTTILAAFVSGTSDEVITYQGNFKTLIKGAVVVNENGTVVKKDQNLIQNYIELMKTRNFAENALKRTDLKLTPQQILGALTIVNIEKSDFLQIKYLSDDKVQTEKVLEAIKNELLAVANDYSDDVNISIEEDIAISEKTDIRNNKLLVVIGFIGGLVIAFILTFILECLNKTFKTKGELERELRLPVIANIPRVKNRKSLNLSESDNDATVVEAYNSLAADIKFGKENNNIKSIAVTSSIKGEGSTTTAINLALALSNSNKTILIDGNFKSNKISEVLKVNSNKGLSDIILDNLKLENVVVNFNRNLDVLTTGSIAENSISILDSKEFDSLICELGKIYEYIIIDAPALQVVADSKVLSKKVDGMILVVKAEGTKKDIIKSSINDIENLGANLLGIVFNFGDRFRNRYYNY
ncbi:polysaccharide biosynthesis tyrosine autokinase [Clostridium tertium]|uniref:polysaccharide biosynthesis tyrosine autokinase n=1 Tax=Clostridium TaxID=1485 RepID=UPI00232E838B|nr:MULTISPECIES: polysaccharide biosynthesis tyrosine autokinase [Clostridium]MDB1953657.1 polysaccharide biosynthesis tyrosine autokinase [Clostridium tertium]MDB1957783.1 polysaccharide biosynthesis tyrosine autokinase [Clostridium tertium]MDB1961182.1 polysaccharide biosynthesis tyrosine autokinase [Clostridium tertium]MDB1964533.1 polysaccharide biosynthesis tyrosine autokinase [Clostridium tertium]MDU1278892.1 polysaccharide biosynthesis tyrosine autokinase [Clostridium sp.]